MPIAGPNSTTKTIPPKSHPIPGCSICKYELPRAIIIKAAAVRRRGAALPRSAVSHLAIAAAKSVIQTLLGRAFIISTGFTNSSNPTMPHSWPVLEPSTKFCNIQSPSLLFILKVPFKVLRSDWNFVDIALSCSRVSSSLDLGDRYLYWGYQWRPDLLGEVYIRLRPHC